MKHSFLILTVLAFLMPLVVQAQTVPAGSFLTRFCTENPTDSFCAQVAEVKVKAIADEKAKSENVNAFGSYIMTRTGNMRSSPNTVNRGNIVKLLEKDVRFTSHRRFYNAGIRWHEIELANGQRGYISTRLTKKIP